MELLKTVKNTIYNHSLISNGDKILIGLSGGSDSVTLLYALYLQKNELSITIEAAHINHCLRDTADRDMNFCIDLCNMLGIKLHILKADIKKEAKENGMSEELYARKVRYSFFDSIPCDRIATAHNKNDNAETITYNFIRGTSLSGLSGIPYKRGKIIRPLLDVPKKDILYFCEKNNYPYMTDETNLAPVYTRNKLRLNIIPQLEKEINKGFTDVITSNSKYLSEDDMYLYSLASSMYNGEIDTDNAQDIESPIFRRMLQLHYKRIANTTENLSHIYIENIMRIVEMNKTGKKTDLPNGYEAYVSYGKLVIEKKTEDQCFEYLMKENVPLFIPELDKCFTLMQSDDGTIYLPDTHGLVIRSKRQGDVFYPYKMKGTKKISDYFTDKKIPKKCRNLIPILVKDNEIVSIIGYRDDRRFKNTDNKSYKLIIKEVKNEN